MANKSVDAGHPQVLRLFDLFRNAMQRAVRDALIAFMAATAQAQAEATKEAQRAGIAHAKANGGARAYKGRKPSYSRKQFESAQAMLANPRVSARSRELRGSRGRQSTASRMIRPAPRRPSPPGGIR